MPLLPRVLEEVQEQQIKAILICLGWTGAVWWPQLAALRTKMALIQFPCAADYLSYPREDSSEKLPRMDPLYTFHIEASWNPAVPILKF